MNRPASAAVALVALVVGGGLTWVFLWMSRALPERGFALAPHPFGVEAGVELKRGADFVGPTADSSVFRARTILDGMGWMAGKDSPNASLEALAETDAALLPRPRQPLLLHLRGRILEALGREGEAESSYALAVRISPQFAYPHVRTGFFRERAGDGLRAEAEYRLALSLWASDPAAYSGGKGRIPLLEAPPYAGLARLFYGRGHSDSAMLVLEYARQCGVADPEIDFLRALIGEERGGLRSADSIYRALMARYPKRARYAAAAATLGFKAPRGEAAPAARAGAVFAISLIEPLAQRFPRNAPLRLALGQAYLYRGLYALAAASLDSALRLDSSLAEARPLREAAYRQWRTEPGPRPDSVAPIRVFRRRTIAKDSVREENAAKVIIPGITGLLGTYSVSWGATTGEVRRAYPGKIFTTLPNGNLRETFSDAGVVHDYLLAFRRGELWGMLILVTDTSTSGRGGDVFGRILRLKAKISGEGRGTGQASCPNGKSFQGVIWENDDTFEFLAQFQGRENQVRLARIAREQLPESRRVCDLERFLEAGAWK